MSLFNALKQRFTERINQDPNNMVTDYSGVDDWETRDKYVRSLRRQVRRIQDETEKEQLQAIINKHQRIRNESWINNTDNVLRYNTQNLKKPKKQESFLGRGIL